MRIAWYNVSIGVSATQRKVARYNMVEYRMEVRYKEGVAYVNGWQLNPAYSRFLSGGEIALRMRIIVLRPFSRPRNTPTSAECRVRVPSRLVFNVYSATFLPSYLTMVFRYIFYKACISL
jgi:hypothetical protein